MDAVLRIGLGTLKYVKAASGLVPNLRVYFTIALYNEAIEEIGIHSRILGEVKGPRRSEGNLVPGSEKQNLRKPQHISTHDTTRVCKSSIY